MHIFKLQREAETDEDILPKVKSNTVKLGNKERFDKEQIGIKELFMAYQPFYTINLLLDKELLPV